MSHILHGLFFRRQELHLIYKAMVLKFKKSKRIDAVQIIIYGDADF